MDNQEKQVNESSEVKADVESSAAETNESQVKQIIEKPQQAPISQVQNSVVLPDIPVVKETPKPTGPTLEELEAQKKAEEQRILEQKKANHDNNFNASEQVLFTQEEEKEGNPIIIGVLFIVLIIFVFALPKIPKFGGKFHDFFTKHTTTVQPTIEEEEETKHKFSDSQIKATIGNLELTNFVRSYQNQNYEINFTIINSADETYIYDKKYYINFYEHDKLIYRALIHSYSPLASKAAKELSLIISKRAYESADSFELEEISQRQYPDVNIQNTNGDYKVLTCKYNNDTIEYNFEDDTLFSVKETYNETSDTTTYEQDKNEMKSISNKYENTEGMTSTFVETPTDFTMLTEFDLKDIPDRTLSNLEVYKFFKFRTSSKIVVFEMSALGYSCDNS